MTILCHNCRNAIHEGTVFCPDCGAPQLVVQGQEARDAVEAGDAAEPVVRHTGEIVWPAAVKSAALYAVPAGLMLSFLAIPLINMLWVVVGSVWTLRRYRRLAPRAPILTPQLGGRIGLVLGLFAAVVSTALNALSALVERFGLHHVSAMDAQVAAAVQNAMSRVRSSDPETAAQLPGLMHFWLSPEGRGWILLTSAAMSAVSILFFAWLAGRYAVRYSARQRPRA